MTEGTAAASGSRCAVHFLFGAAVLLTGPGAASAQIAQKDAVDAAVLARADAAWAAARQIWEWAEPGYQEKRSAALIAGMLQKEGFHVDFGVAGIPTAFVATVGSGKPVVGVLGEYDALPGMAQAATPAKAPARNGTGCGHACGHHLFGVASATACIALGEQFKSGGLKGTLRFYGCPAEEGGSAKAFMTRAGLFADCDAVLHWHPSSRSSAGDLKSLARIAAKFRFHGVAAHAAGAPEQGRSALEAVDVTNHAVALMREHTPDGTRIHHVVTDGGGGAPNVVPDFAEVYYYVRHPDSDVARSLYARLLKCAQAGALATETRLEVIHEGGIVEMLPNGPLGQAAKANLRRLADVRYSPEEREFALRLQKTLPKPAPLEQLSRVDDASGSSMGSTDVADVSWVAPTGGFTTACWPPGTPAHSWQAVAAGGTTIGRQGMMLAARTLAATGWDLFTDANLLAQAKAEHHNRLAGRKYRPLIEPGQNPPLEYRNPPRRATAAD